MASLKIICLIWFAGIFSPSATETRHGWGEKKCGGSLLKHWFNTDIILKPDTTGNRYWSSWWAFTHSGCVGAEGRPTKKILSWGETAPTPLELLCQFRYFGVRPPNNPGKIANSIFMMLQVSLYPKLVRKVLGVRQQSTVSLSGDICWPSVTFGKLLGSTQGPS